MTNTDLKFLVINTKVGWEEGDKRNLEVSDARIALKKEPSHILEREIGKSEGWVKSTDIAVDACGVLYILDGSRILTYDAANKRAERLRCIGGAGILPSQFNDAKGIALSPDTLYVADTGNNRIQAFARINWQIRWVVETTDYADHPIPNGDSGKFKPVDIAVDDKTGNLYALDSVKRRILKFDKGGRFDDGMRVETGLEKPVNIAIDKESFLYVLGSKHLFSIDTALEDELNKSIISEELKKIFKTKGYSLSENATIRKEKEDNWVITDGENIYIVKKEDGNLNIYVNKLLKFGTERKDNLVEHEFELEKLDIEPSGLAVDLEGNVYVGDKREIEGEGEERFIHKFEPSGKYAGPLLGYRGLCYGMVMGEQGNFYVITSEEGEIGLLKYISERYFIKERGGTFISKALDSDELSCRWHKIVLDAEIPDKTQIDVYYHISEKEKSRQDISEWTKLVTFYASDLKLRDALIQDQERSGRYLWFKLELISSDEYKTPKIKSIKAYFPRISYLRYLPAVYQEDAASSDFLERFLSLFETFLWTKEEEIVQIARYFDVKATPGEFISWLATWVAAIFDESWSEEKKRIFLRRAVELYKKRGTREGLEELIGIYTGNKPIIVENFQLYKRNAVGNFKLGYEENEKMESYLFSWDDIPTDSSEELLKFSELIRFLGDGLDICWAEDVKIRKFDDGKTICIYKDEKDLAEITIDEEEKKATLKISDGRIHDMKVKEENGKLNIYVKGTLEKLFGELTPYRFCVLLKPPQKEIESQLKTIKRLIELEKPAHTNAGVVVLQPWIYLDMHTYLGINTYLSKPIMRLGITSVIGRDTVLTCIEGAGQIERRSRTGIDTNLT